MRHAVACAWCAGASTLDAPYDSLNVAIETHRPVWLRVAIHDVAAAITMKRTAIIENATKQDAPPLNACLGPRQRNAQPVSNFLLREPIDLGKANRGAVFFGKLVDEL